MTWYAWSYVSIRQKEIGTTHMPENTSSNSLAYASTYLHLPFGPVKLMMQWFENKNNLPFWGKFTKCIICSKQMHSKIIIKTTRNYNTSNCTEEQRLISSKVFFFPICREVLQALSCNQANERQVQMPLINGRFLWIFHILGVLFFYVKNMF